VQYRQGLNAGTDVAVITSTLDGFLYPAALYRGKIPLYPLNGVLCESQGQSGHFRQRLFFLISNFRRVLHIVCILLGIPKRRQITICRRGNTQKIHTKINLLPLLGIDHE
jgi:hypothetical protein